MAPVDGVRKSPGYIRNRRARGKLVVDAAAPPEIFARG
jgi:hypothetical protein